MCNFQCKIINQHTIALQNIFCKWLWYETKSIVHFTKKGQSTPRLFVFNYQYTNKQSWIRWHSAIMYRYRCPHIYTQIEKTNPIFKTWFVQLKISSASLFYFYNLFIQVSIKFSGFCVEWSVTNSNHKLQSQLAVTSCLGLCPGNNAAIKISATKKQVIWFELC